jgi:hypothetical protein
MGWRYRRRMKVLPGVRMNLSNNGIGWGFGGPWYRVNRSPLGRWSRTIGLPGTGLSNIKRIPSPIPPFNRTSLRRTQPPVPQPAAPSAPVSPQPLSSSQSAAPLVRPMIIFRKPAP